MAEFMEAPHERSGGQITEFIAPLAVDRCAERLSQRHQKRTFFAWDWQTRLTTKVTQVDPTTYRFRLRRVDRNSLLAWGSVVEVNGVLRGLSASQTVVIARSSWSWLWIIVQMVAFAGMGAALSFSFRNEMDPIDQQAILKAVLWALVGMLLGMIFVWWWGSWHLRGMMGALKEATGVGELLPGQGVPRT